MTTANSELNQLIDRLDAMQAAAAERIAASRPADAIDQILASPPRVTATRSLRDDPIMLRVREEELAGLIQVDTMHQVLGLINRALAMLVV